MSNYTHLNNIAVQGSIESSAQGKLIGSFDTMPAASSINAGQIVLYTGATGTYVQGKYYVSNGTSWVLSAASPTAVTVDSALSTTSTNPVQNKVVATALNGKVDVVSGKGLSTNDYTTEEKNKLSGIATGAQVNVIESVKVNGTALTPSSKAVNIDLSGYATKGDVSAIPKFAISVVTDLPTSNISTTTIYLKSNGGSSGNSYDEYIYVNSAWEKIGSTDISLEGYAKTADVNSALAGKQDTISAGTGLSKSGATLSLAASGVSAGSKGSTTAVPVITVDTYGRVTSLTSSTIYPPTSVGTNNQYWKSDGSGAGVWTTPASSPSSGSTTLITAGAVYTSLSNKQDKITVSSSAPSSSTGSNGDLWAVYE